jgi:hypothetical protein
LHPAAGNVGAIPLAGNHRLFLNDNFSA